MNRLALALLAWVGLDPVSVPEPSPPARIVGGELHAGDPAAVAIVARRARCGQAPHLVCTGVLVAPRVVLTAAHCFDTFGVQGEYEIAFGSSTAEASFLVVAGVALDPAYDPETHAHDAAVLLLAEAASVEPVPLAALPEPATGLPARAVGFGSSEAGAASDGYKRQGAMTVTAWDTGGFRTESDGPMTCTGDSGGPVFVSVDGADHLVGITVSGDPGCDEYAWNLRVDAIGDFVAPWLDPATPVPEAWPEGALAVDGICEATCASDAECPAGLACRPGPDMSTQCTLPGLFPGDFGEACDDDAGCGEGAICAQLWPDDCRCLQPCADVGTPPDSAEEETDEPADTDPDVVRGGAGCDSTRGGAPWTLALAAALLLATPGRARSA